MRNVYLDHTATTPVHPKVLEAMLPYFSAKYGNPSNLHDIGREAKNAVEEARGKTGTLIGARADEIFFTASGAESNNFAIKGLAQPPVRPGDVLVTKGEITRIQDRGNLDFLEVSTTTTNQHGRVVALDLGALIAVVAAVLLVSLIRPGVPEKA